ncbi:MAG: gamma-glutamyl-gamma-aminobutyrate hydrolase family protein [Ignavibacteria bacterium]
MRIGISRTDKNFDKFEKWLKYFEVEFIVLDYFFPEEGYKYFNKCDGLILTGGVDIYPELYCDWDTKETKGTYNPERDGFELRLMESAVKADKPVLGICRGLQLINVFFRGSLIFDLPEIRNVNHKEISSTESRFHDVIILKDTLLYKITVIERSNVNSNHHQSIDRLGEGLRINAKSDDGVIEGIEYADRSGKPFLIGVQWHPERFEDPDVPLSANILKRFISECKLENAKHI